MQNKLIPLGQIVYDEKLYLKSIRDLQRLKMKQSKQIRHTNTFYVVKQVFINVTLNDIEEI